MPRREDGGASRPRGRAPRLLPQKGGTGARLQQVTRQNGQEHTDEAQGAETKVSYHVYCYAFLFLSAALYVHFEKLCKENYLKSDYRFLLDIIARER